VRAVIEAMLGVSALIILVALTIQAAPVVIILDNSMVAIVQIVKSMRELGCEPFLTEPNVEIASTWLCTGEDTLN